MSYATHMTKSAGDGNLMKPVRLASRVTQVCRDTIDAIMKRRGISESAVIEQSVRDYAEKLGIPYPDTDIRPAKSSEQPTRVNETKAGYNAEG